MRLADAIRKLGSVIRTTAADHAVPQQTCSVVRLTDLEFFRRQAPWRRVTQQADDLFALIEHGDLCWPQDMAEITRATFTVKFWRQSRARRVTIVPCNRALYSQDEDSAILERWMMARELIQPVTVLSN